MIPYGKQTIDDDDIQAVLDVLKSDFLTQGEKISDFENSLAKYCDTKFAVIFNSGTSALHGAYFSIGLKNNDEFITSPMTFAATSNAGLYLNANPVFCDIEPNTGNIDSGKIENLITDKTKLIVPIHYAGHPCDMVRIKEIADKHDLYVVEDACHALGASYFPTQKLPSQGTNLHALSSKIGSCQFSDMTVFSFHPVKNITTGEGGAVLTNNEELYNKLLMFRNHGITKDSKLFTNLPESQSSPSSFYHEMQFLGYNYRMTDIQAALGITQLKKLDKFIDRRRELASVYHFKFIDNIFFDIPNEKEYAKSAYHLYPLRLKEAYMHKREELFNILRENGLGVQVHYIPVYLHPYYQGLGFSKGLCPFAEKFYQSVISLPIFPKLTDKEINIVIQIVLDSCTKVFNEK